MFNFFAQFRENMFILRNPDNYDYHCSLLTGVLAETDSITYGINCKSALNKLDDFDVCDGQLPQDMMHVLLESVVPYTIKAMLQSFINQKCLFTIDFVNQKLSTLKFSRSECRNKPSQLSSNILHDGNLNQSGKVLKLCLHTLLRAILYMSENIGLNLFSCLFS